MRWMSSADASIGAIRLTGSPDRRDRPKTMTLSSSIVSNACISLSMTKRVDKELFSAAYFKRNFDMVV
jgi:hypothetical protein